MLKRYIFPLFTSVYFVLFFVATTLSFAVWYLSPFIGGETWRPFDGITARIIFIAVIWLFFLTLALIIFLRRRRRERAMTEEIAAQVDTSGDDVTSGEIDELRTKLKTAMAELRKSGNGRKHLNELPWYVMIGPPGAGKTTAIVNSGLQFPLADSMGKMAIGGVGGTRNCDWWFTNDAVLIDTAGRYTTQESDADADNAAWLGFLGLLKKYRKRQPINGAMIAISLSDLLQQDEVTQASHAKAIRRRLNELREKLGVRFPVYVLFTKADLIAGFSEFFDNLGKEDREQVWGFTLPLDTTKGEASPVAAFDSEFALLLGQLNAQSLERIQTETDPQRRSLVAGFPPQVAAMRGVARHFLTEVFQDNRYEQRHMLRGVYFTSGTQEGTPIDRLMLGMARTFGIGRQAIGSGQGQGRSYFLTRLFEGVVFPEAGLVSADDKVERRYRWTKRAAIAATVVVALVTGGLFTRSYLGNQDLIEQASTYVDSYQQVSATLPGSPIGDTDLPPVIDALNILRDMPTNPALGDPDPERRLTYGLYQGEVIGTQAAQTYRSALNQRFLPRLLLRLEEQIAANVNNPDLLYEALKIYLMLGLEGPMNTDLVKEWMAIDWSVSFAGPSRAGLRDDLTFHLNALMSQPMEKIALNGPLVERVQAILSEMPLAQRVYNGIIASSSATSLPKWRLTEAGGPAVARVLVRSSGKPLNDGVEGIFTYSGFHNVFLGEAAGIAKRIQNESWVLGPQGEAEQTAAVLNALSRDVLSLYYNDFVARYDAILGDIDIIPLESLSHAVEVTNVLSGPTSPLVNILNEISRETSLTVSAEAFDSEAISGATGRIAQMEARNVLSVQGQILLEALQSSPSTNGGGAPEIPGAYVEERFEWVHTLVERPEGQDSQMDQLVFVLREVYDELNKMSFSGVAATAAEGGSATQRFKQMAARIPGPMERWASQITSTTTGITADGTRSSINQAWQSSVLPFCTQALDNRYPFNRRARADVAIADFQKLFAPGGMIDAFFAQNLSKYVDTGARPWAWKKVNDVDLGISPAVLVQFQNAAAIRDAFFAGAATPSVSFQITPEALDPKAKSVQLTIGSQNVLFETRRPNNTPVAITWPGSVGLAGVVFKPSIRDGENQLAKDGPWALFRLLDAATIRRTNVSDRTRIIFNVSGRIANFSLQTGSVLNPFALPALSKFSCPKSF